MAIYTYEAISRDQENRVMHGTISADGPTEARAMLRAQGYVARQLQEGTGKKAKAAGLGKKQFHFRPNHIAVKELAWMAHKLASSASTGVSLTRSFEVMAAQRPKSPLAPILTDIAKRIQRGQGMGAAFEAYTAQLTPTTIALVKAGEISGTMDVALERLGEMYDDRRELQQTVRSAIVYPVLSLVFSLGIAMFLLIVIVPKFQAFFVELHGKLPALTQFLVNISDGLRHHLLMIPVVIIGLGFAIVKGRKTAKVSRFMDSFLIRVPIIGPVFEGAVLARIAGTLSTLLGAGLGIQESLTLSADVANNQVYKEILIGVREDMVRDGAALSRALQIEGGNRVAELALAAQTGEENGQLVDSLNRYARETAAYVRAMTKGLAAALEPVMIMLIGGIVGTIVVAFYLPEFALIKAIHP